MCGAFLLATSDSAPQSLPEARSKFLSGLYVTDGDLAAATVFLGVEKDLLAFRQTAHASALESRCVDEYVLAAVSRSDEAEALLVIIEFHCTWCHSRLPFQGLVCT